MQKCVFFLNISILTFNNCFEICLSFNSNFKCYLKNKISNTSMYIYYIYYVNNNFKVQKINDNSILGLFFLQ